MVRNPEVADDGVLMLPGDRAKVAPNILLICDPEAVIRTNPASSHYTKSTWYNFSRMEHDKHNVFSQSDEEETGSVRHQHKLHFNEVNTDLNCAVF